VPPDAGAQVRHRPDHARPGHAARPSGGFADQGFCGLRARGLVDRHRRAPAGRHAIDVALFTNFTRDHLDYHGSMAGLLGGQARAVRLARPARRGDQRRRRTRRERWRRTAGPAGDTAGPVDRLAAAARRGCARGPALRRAAWPSTVVEGGEQAPGAQPLVGDYNASNLLVVLGGLRALGVPLADAAAVRWRG
jgi:murE/murF fusion protein